MVEKVAIEEHFCAIDPDAPPEMAGHFDPREWPEIRDIQEQRLRLMDECNIAKSVLSLTQPGIQALHDPEQAIAWATRVNDYVAEQVARRPDRFAAFCAVPMQDSDAAARELRRAVTDLGLVGALINGYSQVGAPDNYVYLDDDRYEPFWAEVQALDVPVYIHPRFPIAAPQYEGHPWLLGAMWAFAAETGTHALRLMGSGMFDRHPGVSVILGHMGELLPYGIWRADHRIGLSSHRAGIRMKETFGHYLRNNFYLTTSGVLRTPALIDAILEVGAERIMFATDYPYETMHDAARWLDALEIGDTTVAKIAYQNAERVLRLP